MNFSSSSSMFYRNRSIECISLSVFSFCHVSLPHPQHIFICQQCNSDFAHRSPNSEQCSRVEDLLQQWMIVNLFSNSRHWKMKMCWGSVDRRHMTHSSSRCVCVVFLSLSMNFCECLFFFFFILSSWAFFCPLFFWQQSVGIYEISSSKGSDPDLGLYDDRIGKRC